MPDPVMPHQNARARLLLAPDVAQDAAGILRLAASCGYATLDPDSPTARYRGTFLAPTADGGTELAGWQRNIIRVQRMDSSLPTPLRIRLDRDGRVVEVALEKTFAGSRGVLCYQPYLTRRLEELLLGRRFAEVSTGEITSSNFGCFHVAEVLADMMSAQAVAEAKGISTFFEQECLDSVRSGDSMTMFGTQEIRGLGTVSYRVHLDGVFSAVHFDEHGGIYSRTPVMLRTYLADECLTEREVAGATPPVFLLSLQRATRGLLLGVGAALGVTSPPLMCTNLSPQAFVGALVLAIGAKQYSNNYVYILHCLSGLQRRGGVPRCLGGVETQAEADATFPGFNVRDAVLGR